MMPWHFINISEDEKLRRRELLDHNATLAQALVLIPLASTQLYLFLSSRNHRLHINGRHDGTYRAWLSSPLYWCRRLLWWTGNPSLTGYGTNGSWIVSLSWTGLLLFLCARQTGDDYLHLTKRFGIVGASQLPLHFLLAWKSPYSPVQLLARLSHEELNIYHRISGRIIILLFLLHASFYTYFFVASGLLAKRIRDADVLLGLLSISLFAVTGITSLRAFRKWSYRAFMVFHSVGPLLLIPVLYFHVKYIRPYIWESAVIYVVGQVLRQVNTITVNGTVSALSGTNLLQIKLRMPPSWLGLRSYYHLSHHVPYPAQHVYLSAPIAHPNSSKLVVMRFRTNPFTIASLSKSDNAVTIIARVRSGVTRQLSRFASSENADGGAKGIPLSIEGAYGQSRHLPDLANYDVVLLVSGGVGATFTVPMYRSLRLAQLSGGRLSTLRFVWACRTDADTRWALTQEMLDEASLRTRSDDGANGSSRKTMIEIYLTRSKVVSDEGTSDLYTNMESYTETDEIELTVNRPLLNNDDVASNMDSQIRRRYGRPNLTAITDDTFSACDALGSVAVLFCGPNSMSSQLRHEAGKWVHRGRNVFWHAEQFDF